MTGPGAKTAPGSFEIIDGLLHGRPVPRMGLRENIWGQTLRQWVAEGYPTDEEGRPIDPVEHFGHDWAGVGGGFDWHPVPGYSEVLEETDQWRITRDGAGAALKRWKEKAGTPEHIDFRMTSREVWQRDYRPHLLAVDPERFGDTAAAAEDLKRRRRRGVYTLFGSQFIFECMRASFGDLCMYESFLLDPAWIRDYCRVYTDFFIAHYRLRLERVGMPDAVRLCEDLGYKNGLFCSPASLAELVFPYYAEIVAFFHSLGLPVLLHSCGGVTEALELIVQAGFDALDPMERAAGCDPVAFARRTDNRLVLSGGLDKRVLESGDRRAIREAVVALTRAVRDNGIRYVFSTDHSVSTNAAYADYCYMLDVFRDHMHY